MTTNVGKGKLWIVNLEKDGTHQAIPPQDMLHELQPYNQIKLYNKKTKTENEM